MTDREIKKYVNLMLEKRDTFFMHLARRTYLKPNNRVKNWCYQNLFYRSFNYYEVRLTDEMKQLIINQLEKSEVDLKNKTHLRIDISCRYGILLNKEKMEFIPLKEKELVQLTIKIR